MIRNYKFRAQRVLDKMWVFGDLLFSHEGCHIVESQYFKPSNDEAPELTEVIPETVGQYIGNKDIDGNDLYEGDFVKYQYLRYRKPIVVVAFIEYKYYGFYLSKNETKLIDSRALMLSHKLFERVGNIHDNPELLHA